MVRRCLRSDSVVSRERHMYSTGRCINSQKANANHRLNGPGGLEDTLSERNHHKGSDTQIDHHHKYVVISVQNHQNYRGPV